MTRFVALDALRLYAANHLVVMGESRFASVLQQLIDCVNRAADNALDRAHRHLFAEQFENLGALGALLPAKHMGSGEGRDSRVKRVSALRELFREVIDAADAQPD